MNKEMSGFSEEMKNLILDRDIEEGLLERREIFLWSDVNDSKAEEIVKRILYFNGKGKEDITLFINSPGGSISAGLAIYDAMEYSDADVRTVCMGQAASMGAVILAAGSAGKRSAWPNARMMIHQPLISGNMIGPASDIQIQAEEMLRLRERLNNILAHHTGKSVKQISKDSDRDNFLDAEEAKEYGLIDSVRSGK
ncbi:MAG: ClpP family protease [Chitinivibrionales bacterium]